MENRMRKRMTVILNSKMNMRRFYVSAALLLTTLLAVAENNPYRSDVFWVTVPDHADWLYKTGEQANVEVQFYKYGIPGDSIAINFEIGGEMMPADTKGTVIMRKGKATATCSIRRKKANTLSYYVLRAQESKQSRNLCDISITPNKAASVLK